MYRKESKGWVKHYDFILLDLICLQLAFILSYVLRHGMANPYLIPLYRNMAIVFELADIVVIFFFESLKNVLKRGYYQEFAVTVKHVLLVQFLSVLYLFTVQEGVEYSRLVLYSMSMIYAVLTYIVRILWKKVLQKEMTGGGNRSLLIVTTQKMAPDVVHNLKNHNYERFSIAGIAVVDQDLTGSMIEGIPVVASADSAPNYVCREWIDEVFVIFDADYLFPQTLINKFVKTGVTVHLNLARASQTLGKKQLIEKVGSYTVLTTSMNYATAKQAFMKRTMDIVGGLVGCILTGVIFIFVGPMIYVKSPGPIFFSQVRVGKNGKKFSIYKFRSMYMDAEERKKELMEQNKMKDGFMFKLDYDPRIIGSEKLGKDGKPKGIGNFIRKTSIDEFPQFWNVLKGEMSLVGTRPPTLDEWEQYDLHHRARMAIKPGITGMWQVSGRSDIIDFEEVVRLDTEYIENWNIGLDIKIICKTVLAVLKNEGAV